MPRARKEFSKSVKVAAFERSKGLCECCTTRLEVGRFQYDHILAAALGGPPTLENCKVLCTNCHGRKTGLEDVPVIAKSNRVRNKHIGAAKRSRNVIPGSKRSPWKRKLDGTTVRRDK